MEVITMNSRLKKIRLDAQLSQKEFGENIGMSRAEIANLELGRTPFRPIKIKIICEYYNVDKEWFLTGEGHMHGEESKEKDIAKIVSALYKEDDLFRFELIKMLSSMDDNDLNVFRDFLKELYEKTMSN